MTDESNEFVNVRLFNPTGGAQLINPLTTTLTIIDNDNAPTISINDVSLAEGNENSTTFTFVARLSSASAFATSVNWTTENGTADSTSDYIAASGTVSFSAGETTKPIRVQVNGDSLIENNENFNVNLSAPVQSTIGDGTGVGTILNDDKPGKFSFSHGPYSGSENTSVLVTVSRTDGTAGTVSVNYRATGDSATPSTDFASVSGTLIFASGETSKTFTVDLIDDQTIEPVETVNLFLSNPTGGAILGTPSTAALSILDDDSATLYTINGEILKIGNLPLGGVTVNLTGARAATTTTDDQGRYSFPNLLPNGNYSITPSAASFTFNPTNRQFNNLSANITTANFTATAVPARQLHVIGGIIAPTQDVKVNIDLDAQGDEHSVEFSLEFDPAILTNPRAALGADALTAFLTSDNSQVETGRLDVQLSLPANQNFTLGTKRIITVTFNTLSTAAYNSSDMFGDMPSVKQVLNSNAESLPVNYLNGVVIFTQGWEADVSARSNGDGAVSSTDVSMIQGLQLGFGLPYQSNEFQRADCAPFESRGDGRISSIDVA